MVEITVFQLTEEARSYWFLGSIHGPGCVYRENGEGKIMVPAELYEPIGNVEVSETVGVADEDYAEYVFSGDQFGRYSSFLHKNGERTTSVSDVFAVKRNKKCRTYFADSIGWTEVEFVAKEDWEKLPPLEKGRLPRGWKKKEVAVG